MRWTRKKLNRLRKIRDRIEGGFHWFMEEIIFELYRRNDGSDEEDLDPRVGP